MSTKWLMIVLLGGFVLLSLSTDATYLPEKKTPKLPKISKQKHLIKLAIHLGKSYNHATSDLGNGGYDDVYNGDYVNNDYDYLRRLLNGYLRPLWHFLYRLRLQLLRRVYDGDNFPSRYPTDPYDPTDPFDPSVDPNDPFNPSVDPNDPYNPFYPNDPFNPFDPTDPYDLNNPEDPTDPYDPNGPFDPNDPPIQHYEALSLKKSAKRKRTADTSEESEDKGTKKKH
ncbi:circumsporozoite protein-like [Gigantopelta aegis]|uniref:circumsporozoite protein-like n=1 Tax=Gigantopelta aegis TaxID=1735272 RepID=UPI001B88A890|nr:circumsporozoite protein-like [Gigantopelta aegis]